MWGRDTGSAALGLCCAVPRAGRWETRYKTSCSTPLRAACPWTRGLGVLREPRLLSEPLGLEQLELLSAPHGPPSECDLPDGIASGTRPPQHGAVSTIPIQQRSEQLGFPAGVNATVTPASARRTRQDGWCACASTTRPAPTASTASPSTRTGPGRAARLRLPMSASVSSTRVGHVAVVRSASSKAALVGEHRRVPIRSVTPRTLIRSPRPQPALLAPRSLRLQRPLGGMLLRRGDVPPHRAWGALPELPRQHGRATLRAVPAEPLPLGAAGRLPALPLPPRRCVGWRRGLAPVLPSLGLCHWAAAPLGLAKLTYWDLGSRGGLGSPCLGWATRRGTVSGSGLEHGVPPSPVGSSGWLCPCRFPAAPV